MIQQQLVGNQTIEMPPPPLLELATLKLWENPRALFACQTPTVVLQVLKISNQGLKTPSIAARTDLCKVDSSFKIITQSWILTIRIIIIMGHPCLKEGPQLTDRKSLSSSRSWERCTESRNSKRLLSKSMDNLLNLKDNSSSQMTRRMMRTRRIKECLKCKMKSKTKLMMSWMVAEDMKKVRTLVLRVLLAKFRRYSIYNLKLTSHHSPLRMFLKEERIGGSCSRRINLFCQLLPSSSNNLQSPPQYLTNYLLHN